MGILQHAVASSPLFFGHFCNMILIAKLSAYPEEKEANRCMFGVFFLVFFPPGGIYWLWLWEQIARPHTRSLSLSEGSGSTVTIRKACYPFPQFLHFRMKQKKELLGSPAFLLKTTCARDTFLVWLSKNITILTKGKSTRKKVKWPCVFNSSFFILFKPSWTQWLVTLWVSLNKHIIYFNNIGKVDFYLLKQVFM